MTLEKVLHAYYKCRKNKRKTKNSIEFELNFEENCVNLLNDINNRTYKIGKSICFVVTRPKYREVFAANFRDRIIHHVIINELEELFEKEFIPNTFNCRKNKGVLCGINYLGEAVKKCSENYTKECYMLKLDFSNFFMSIDKNILLQKLLKFIDEKYVGDFKDDLVYLVTKVVLHCPQDNCIKKSPNVLWERLPKGKSLFTCDKNKGEPIGNLTSQMFANFDLNELDQFLASIFLFYGRYVDDLDIVSQDKDKLLKIISKVEKLSNKIGIGLNSKKKYLQSYNKGCNFIGGVIKGNRKYVGNRIVSNCLKCINKYNELIKRSLLEAFRRRENFISSLNSYFGYFKHYNTFNIKSKIRQKLYSKWTTFIKFSKDKIICNCKRIDLIKFRINRNDQNIWSQNRFCSYQYC